MANTSTVTYANRKKVASAVILANDSNEWQNQNNSLSASLSPPLSGKTGKNTLKDFIDDAAVLKLIKTLNLGS
jgi:hypothetical protein